MMTTENLYISPVIKDHRIKENDRTPAQYIFSVKRPGSVLIHRFNSEYEAESARNRLIALTEHQELS